MNVCGLTIEPGDLLHGDENGLLTVPREIAAELPEKAQEVCALEKPLFEALKKPGMSVDEIKKVLNVH